MTMLCFAISDPTIKRDRLMKICLVHDLAEAIVGDITPHDGVTKEEKRKLEEVSMMAMKFKLYSSANVLTDSNAENNKRIRFSTDW
jgi:putative hydrolase of HD superfamily